MTEAFICGIKIACGTRDELLSLAKSLVGVGGTIFTPNPLILNIASDSADYGRLLSSSTINIPDGVGVKYILARRGVKADVLPGVELGEALVAGHSFAIIGGKDERARAACERLAAAYPDSTPLFAFSGYGYDEQMIKDALSRAKPDICIVCLGAPMQEYFIERVRHSSEKTLYLALGGSVDVYSGSVKRAPQVFRRAGLEWLYRAVKEPKRFRRIPRLISFFVREFFTVLNKK